MLQQLYSDDPDRVMLALFHERPLHEQFGISFRLEKKLHGIGIMSMADLLQTGSATAYRRLQKAGGGRILISYLYAFEGAILGQHWYEFSKEEKAEIRTRAGLS